VCPRCRVRRRVHAISYARPAKPEQANAARSHRNERLLDIVGHGAISIRSAG
jgi:hypothetical protein